MRHALPVRIDATPDGTPADPGLAELGLEQASRVADALRHDKVDALYTSPSRRAVETAAPLAAVPLAARYALDPSKIAALGFSAGGHADQM